MDALIAVIERELPGMAWLVRSVDDGADMEHIGARYFAHIHGAEMAAIGYAQSFQGTGTTPHDALNQAFSLAASKATPS